MTIREVRCSRLTADLHTPFVTALRSTRTLETLVVEVVDDDGLRGFGEAPQVWRVTGESLESAQACVEGPLSAAVCGRSADDLNDLVLDVRQAVVGNWSAKAAVDVALHDLVARCRGISLPVFLGSCRHQVDTDVTISAGPVEELTTGALKRVAEGFRVLKLKVGTSADADIERVSSVREAVGADVIIRVDANQGWTVREAVAVIRALEDAGAGLEFVEQPVSAYDVEGLATVTAAVDTPVMADESVFDLRDLTTVIQRRAADLVNIKLAKCGGLSAARSMLDLARAHDVGVIVGSMMEGPIGVGAAASLVAAFGTSCISDLDAAWWLASSPVVGGLSYDAGTLRLPEGPGLGILGLA